MNEVRTAAAASPHKLGPIPGSREHLNRELSLLAFHTRVHAMARDPAVPLLERLRFLCISSSNLDEFVEVRLARLKQQQCQHALQHRK